MTVTPAPATQQKRRVRNLRRVNERALELMTVTPASVTHLKCRAFNVRRISGCVHCMRMRASPPRIVAAAPLRSITSHRNPAQSDVSGVAGYISASPNLGPAGAARVRTTRQRTTICFQKMCYGNDARATCGAPAHLHLRRIRHVARATCDASAVACMSS